MRGKIAVLTIIIFTIIFVIFTWFYLQYIINEFDIDRAIEVTDDLQH